MTVLAAAKAFISLGCITNPGTTSYVPAVAYLSESARLMARAKELEAEEKKQSDCVDAYNALRQATKAAE